MRVCLKRLCVVLCVIVVGLRPMAGNADTPVDPLESQYAATQSLELLYQLGISAEARGERTLAADLLGRYLAEASDEISESRRTQIQTIVAGRGTGGELAVISESGSLIYVDQRLLGVLPLPKALFLAPGTHQVSLRSPKGKGPPGKRPERLQIQVEIRPHRRLLLRSSERGGTTLTSPPTILLIVKENSGTIWTPLLTKAIEEVLPKDRSFLLIDTNPNSLLQKPDETNLANQLRRGRTVHADFVLEIAVDPVGKQSKLVTTLIDVQSGATAGRANPLWVDAVSLSANLGPLVKALLEEGTTRATGKLRITSKPEGAFVMIAGEERGTTPFTRDTFAGPSEVTLHLRGYLSQKRSVHIAENATTSLDVELRRRPLRATEVLFWTGFATGSAALGTGFAFLGLHGYQDCSRADVGHCPLALDGYTSSIAPFVSAGVLLGGAVLSLGLDRKKAKSLPK